MKRAEVLLHNDELFGLLLYNNDKIEQAWLDPEYVKYSIYKRMSYHNDDPKKVLGKVDEVLLKSDLIEVDPEKVKFQIIYGE